MNIYLIKHRGKTWVGNFLGQAMTMSIGGYECYTQYCFYRKKDALAYLKAQPYPEYFEVTVATLTPSKKDNRRQ